MKDDLVEIDAVLIHTTDEAFLVLNDDRKIWLPRSQTTRNKDGAFTMPQWLAYGKGLI